MPLELTVLGLSVLLAVVQLVLYAVPGNLQLGIDYTTGPRDERRALTGLAGRFHRAFGNHIEGLVLYTAAVVLVVLGNASTPVTRWAAVVYLVARVLYVPAYALGIRYVRSLVWAVGFFATIAMVLAALL